MKQYNLEAIKYYDIEVVENKIENKIDAAILREKMK